MSPVSNSGHTTSKKRPLRISEYEGCVSPVSNSGHTTSKKRPLRISEYEGRVSPVRFFSKNCFESFDIKIFNDKNIFFTKYYNFMKLGGHSGRDQTIHVRSYSNLLSVFCD